MENPYIFRSKTVWISAAITYTFTGILVIQTVLVSNLRTNLIAIFLGALVCNLAYLLFIRPKIAFFNEGIVITNPLTKFTIGWHEVESIDSRYTMSISVAGKKIHAWAAPAPGRYHARTLHASEIKGLKLESNTLLRPGDSPRSESGQAQYLAKMRLEAFQKGNFEGLARSTQFNVIGMAITVIAALCVLLLYKIIP